MQSYLLQVDLVAKKTDRLIPLMDDPFRHAGGIQVVVIIWQWELKTILQKPFRKFACTVTVITACIMPNQMLPLTGRAK